MVNFTCTGIAINWGKKKKSKFVLIALSILILKSLMQEFYSFVPVRAQYFG